MIKLEAWRLGTEQLSLADVRDARWQAELLLRSALRESRARFLASLGESADVAGLRQYLDWLAERRLGVPLQYLLGRQEFMGLEIEVTPAVLIPRPDTEVLVEEAIRLLKDLTKPLVSDLATGSGAIALALASQLPRVTVLATDISSFALQVARGNAERLGLADKVTFRQGSWTEPLRGQRFQAIVSNPPYIPSAEIATLSQEVQQEPRLALDGGLDGLDCYRALIPEAACLLAPGGHLLLEVGQGQAKQVLGLMQAAGLQELYTARDLAGIERVVVGEKQGGNRK